MKQAEMKRVFYRRIHSLAVSIDIECLIGTEIVNNEKRVWTAKESENAKKVRAKILEDLNKKSKIEGKND